MVQQSSFDSRSHHTGTPLSRQSRPSSNGFVAVIAFMPAPAPAIKETGGALIHSDFTEGFSISRLFSPSAGFSTRCQDRPASAKVSTAEIIRELNHR